eukprot:PhM_4_TR14891/c0_g1_i2/m.93353
MSLYGAPSGAAPIAPSVLTSDIHNEADLIFKLLQDKEKQLVSMLDCWTLMRGMGMNPTNFDMEQLFDSMQAPLAKIAEERAKEEEKKNKGKKKEETKKEAKKGEEKEEEKGPTEAPEDEKKIDWDTFITAAEAQFKDVRVETEELELAMSVLDKRGVGYLTKEELEKAMRQSGESVLSPAELKLLMDMFPRNKIPFQEFIQKIFGTWVEPEGGVDEIPDLPAAAATSGDVRRTSMEGTLGQTAASMPAASSLPAAAPADAPTEGEAPPPPATEGDAAPAAPAAEEAAPAAEAADAAPPAPAPES